MERRKLGRTGIEVSQICLGTMTWGEQNTEAEAHRQLDVALDHGVDFIDSAEMYPVPPKAETQGLTETYIGTWMKARRCRHKVILATKATGRSAMGWVRGPGTREIRPDRANILAAAKQSLARLQTDYIDLYQIHWPDRQTNYFGKLGYVHKDESGLVPFEETLGALQELIDAGTVRAVGLSNETPWGVMKYLAASEGGDLPRMASIQNPYSLLNRSFEVGLAEIAHREDIGLLAYSPLAFGCLTGKYAGGARPAGARLSLFPSYARYMTPAGQKATDEYVALAKRHGLDPAQMALAWVNSRSFTTATIIGATSLGQLETNLGSIDVKLSDDVIKGLEDIQARWSNPCP